MQRKNNLNENLERRVEAVETWKKKQAKEKRINAAIGITAPAISGAAAYKFLGKEARKAGEFIGETIDAVKVAKRLLTPDSKSAEVENYIKRINPDTAEAYLSSRNESYLSKLEDSTRLLLDSGGRASENFPGSTSKPVKGLRDLKGRIIESTAFWREKEETETRNTEQYQENYNHLAAIRFSAINKLRQINKEIEGYCDKLSINEARGIKIAEKELNLLEKMAKEYNAMAGIAQGSTELSVQEINQGIESQQYTSIISEAKEYGIKTPNYQMWGDRGIIATTIIAAYLGNKIAKPATFAVKEAYKTGASFKGIVSKVMNSRKAAKHNKD